MKYKLTFKGLDESFKDHSQAILEFLKKNYPEASNVEMYFRNSLNPENDAYYFYVTIPYMTGKKVYSFLYWPARYGIRKKNDITDDYIPMYKAELKFFDSLDLEIFEDVGRITNQSIEDWWSMK